MWVVKKRRGKKGKGQLERGKMEMVMALFFSLRMKRTTCGVTRKSWKWRRGGRRWSCTRGDGDGDRGDDRRALRISRGKISERCGGCGCRGVCGSWTAGNITPGTWRVGGRERWCGVGVLCGRESGRERGEEGEMEEEECVQEIHGS